MYILPHIGKKRVERSGHEINRKFIYCDILRIYCSLHYSLDSCYKVKNNLKSLIQYADLYLFEKVFD